MMMPPELQSVVLPSCPVKQRMIDYCEGIEEAKGLTFDYHITHDFQVDFRNRNKTTFFQKHEIRISHDGIPFRHFSGSSLEAVWEKFVNFVDEIKKQKHKMTITTELEFGQTVYFKNDKEQVPYMVIGVQCDPQGIAYRISNCGVEKIVFSIEITTEKAEKATASFKKN